MQAPPAQTPFAAIQAAEISHVLADLGIAESDVSYAGQPHEGARALLVAAPPGASVGLASQLLETAEAELSESGALLLFLEGRRPESELAAWRNAIWPLLHVGVLYSQTTEGITRRTLSGRTPLESGPRKAHHVRSGHVIVARRRVHAMSPDATIEKFDANASGWNGDPGGPGYPHFRWMRRYVGCFANLPKDASILDFGCGAGWCGIEAAQRFGASSLRFFDPSPEMVRIAENNAKQAGLTDAAGRTGFGEAPPYPAEGEERFDAVISSGVVSFSPDTDKWIEGLVNSVKPGGLLVIGDINRDSRGMQRRRREKALLPAREMNAQTAGEIRARLEAEGFEHFGSAGYQLTRPFPEAMHVNETKLSGLLTYPLLWSNQLSASAAEHIGLPSGRQFDSWVMRFKRKA
jgi:SAM-dependent methyltransferase